jgi:peptidoglycan/LPS O-acetylase OafA/YrhL
VAQGRRLQPIHSQAEPSHPWNSRLDVLITIALGLTAIVIAGSIYLNEHQEHDATLDFHQATHHLILATAAGLRTPSGRALAAGSEAKVTSAEDHQDKAARYTLAEVILATSLFLFGVAGLSARWRMRIGVFGCGAVVFVVALVVLATV